MQDELDKKEVFNLGKKNTFTPSPCILDVQVKLEVLFLLQINGSYKICNKSFYIGEYFAATSRRM